MLRFSHHSVPILPVSRAALVTCVGLRNVADSRQLQSALIKFFDETSENNVLQLQHAIEKRATVLLRFNAFYTFTSSFSVRKRIA